jgi:hypothetical protein
LFDRSAPGIPLAGRVPVPIFRSQYESVPM